MHFGTLPRVADADLADLRAATALVQRARALGGDAAAERRLLAGKKLALLSPSGEDDGAREFAAAASALGAHVSFVQPGLGEGSSAQQVAATARMLGQLYDAVECQHLPAGLVRRLADDAGIPVFDGLATPAHATSALAEQLPAELPLALRRRRILQAALLASMA